MHETWNLPSITPQTQRLRQAPTSLTTSLTQRHPFSNSAPPSIPHQWRAAHFQACPTSPAVRRRSPSTCPRPPTRQTRESEVPWLHWCAQSCTQRRVQPAGCSYDMERKGEEAVSEVRPLPASVSNFPPRLPAFSPAGSGRQRAIRDMGQSTKARLVNLNAVGCIMEDATSTDRIYSTRALAFALRPDAPAWLQRRATFTAPHTPGRRKKQDASKAREGGGRAATRYIRDTCLETTCPAAHQDAANAATEHNQVAGFRRYNETMGVQMTSEASRDPCRWKKKQESASSRPSRLAEPAAVRSFDAPSPALRLRPPADFVNKWATSTSPAIAPAIVDCSTYYVIHSRPTASRCLFPHLRRGQFNRRRPLEDT